MMSQEHSKAIITQNISLILIGLSFCGFIFIFSAEISNKWKTEEILKNEKYETLIGFVKDYESYAPRGKQIRESFKIENIEFYFEEWDGTYFGYRPSYKSNLIKNDQFLRIKYYVEGKKKIVLKIEEKKIPNSIKSVKSLFESEIKNNKLNLLLIIF